jgi:hypothetical protein
MSARQGAAEQAQCRKRHDPWNDPLAVHRISQRHDEKDSHRVADLSGGAEQARGTAAAERSHDTSGRVRRRSRYVT